MPDRIYRLSKGYISWALRTMSTWRVEGLENVPKEGPLLVIANHLSNMDPVLMTCSLPRRLYFLSKREIFKPGVAQFLRAYGAYPVDRDRQDRDGFNWCRRMLAQGGGICMFPEGMRVPTGGMARALPGTAFMALHTKAPILPVGIIGTEHIGPIPQVFFPTGKITVKIGKVFTLDTQKRVRREELQNITTGMMLRVAELLPPEYRGVYTLPSENAKQT